MQKYTNYTAVVSVIVFLLASFFFYSYFQLGDDTYIYLQYAKNLLKNGELAFNSGVPSYGFTAPLWLFLLTGIVGITHTPLIAPAILSLIFGVASVLTWVKIIQVRSESNSKLYFFLLFIILDPNLLKHSFLGMEATGSFFFSSLLIYVLMAKEKPIHTLWFGVFSALFVLIRPESVLLYFLFAGYMLYIKKYDLRQIGISFLFFIIVLVPWYVFAYMQFGYFFPSTFSARGGAYVYWSLVTQHFSDTIKIMGGNYVIHIFIIAYILLKFRNRRVTIEHIFCFIVILSFLVFYFSVINAELLYARYFCVFIPFFLYYFYDIYKSSFKLFSPQINIITATALIMLIWLLSAAHRQNFESIELFEDRLIEWVNKNTSPQAKILRHRIGKIAYHTERYIIDPVGLVNKEIIPYNVQGKQSDYYRMVKPEYFIYEDATQLRNIGSKDYILVMEFSQKLQPMLRNIFSTTAVVQKIRIYKVNWD